MKLLSITTALVVALLGFAGQSMAQLSVTISDNVVILDEKRKSGSIDLVNLGADPVEFSVATLDDNRTASGEELIRWAPSRVLVPPHRSARLRVMARNTASIAEDEQLIRLGITAAVQQAPRPINPTEDTTDAVAVTVPVIPTLPLFVYVRNKNIENLITLESFVTTPDHEKFSGYFPISKSAANRSFVGQVKVINKETNEILSEGRVHLPQGTEKSLVQVLRGEKSGTTPIVHCIQLWDQYPGQGNPSQTVCP